MTDRELLELAARAAGFDGCYVFRASGKNGTGLPYDINGFELVGGAMWNPLRSDGDALRLAMNVGLTVRTTVECNANGSNRRGRVEVGEIIENFEGGRQAQYAVTRRAIVRAAAEIGRSA